MGNLIVNKINLNDRKVIKKLIKVIGELVQTSCYYPLKFKPPYYFIIPGRKISSERGWYIILEGKKPLYAGKADNLNKRLNTNSGSIDNFANTGRKFDPERNFIKKFANLKIFTKLRVCIITEKEICSKLGISNLTELDRGNVEKIINIFRCHFDYYKNFFSKGE